jgi:predicted transposase/invertase (TIGR01784 family)
MNHYRCLIYGHYRQEPAALAIIAYRPSESERLYYSHCRYATEIIYRYNNLVLPDLDDDELISSDSPTDLVLYAAKHAAQVREELQKYRYLRHSIELLGKRGWSREDKRDLLLFIERILYLHDEELKARYVEYRHQLSEEGKIVFIPMGEEKTAMEIERRGMEKGKEEGKLEVARNMLARGIEPDIIVACSGLSHEKIRELTH